jgi:DNA invertase Pin-like site-specific DNA recombinase
MTAIGYIRRSRVDTRKPGALSHQQQREAIERLAAVHGDDPATIEWIEDWGKSGRAEKQHLREGFARLEELVESGGATVIYSYSANRLARSLETLARLAKKCERAGVPIRCADGYSPDVTTSTGRMILNILGSIAQWQAEWVSERMLEATAIRKANGHHVGPAPFGFRVVDGKLVDNPAEDIEVVKSAYRRTGAFQAAARLLTTEKVPTRSGGNWSASAIRDMLEREAPEILPVRRKQGRTSSSFRFSGLLLCAHDGAMLTGRTYRGKYVAYACRKSATDPTHPRPHSIAEPAIQAWAKEEAARFRVPGDTLEEAEGFDRDAYEAHRKRIIVAFMDGLIERDERDERLEALAAEADKATTSLSDIPQTIDWDRWDASSINRILRAYWSHVELDEAMQPVRADWRLPAEYIA